MNCNIIPINTDQHGMDPQSLSDVMSDWSPADIDNPQSGLPKMMYLIPNGGNPTGHSLTEERKREIYKIAQKYNLLILEDDPYFYLQFNKVSSNGQSKLLGVSDQVRHKPVYAATACTMKF